MLCEAAAYYKTLGKTLWDVLEDLYAEFGYYLDALTNVVHKGSAGALKIAALTESLRSNPPVACEGVAVVEVEDYKSEHMQAKGFPVSDVLRFLLADGSWVAVRPSGTEPKCKYYYCVTGTDREDAMRKHTALRRVFER